MSKSIDLRAYEINTQHRIIQKQMRWLADEIAAKDCPRDEMDYYLGLWHAYARAAVFIRNLIEYHEKETKERDAKMTMEIFD